MIGWLSDFFLIELPVAFCMLWLGLSAFQLSFQKLRKRGLVFTVVQALALLLHKVYQVPYEVKVIAAVPLMSVITYAILRLPLRLSFVFSLVVVIPVLVTEAIVMILFSAFDISPVQVITHFPTTVAVVWLRLLGLFSLALVLRKKQVNLLRYFPDTKQGRYLAYLVIVGGIELLLIAGANTSYNVLPPRAESLPLFTHFPVLLILILLLFIVMIALFRIYLATALTRVETETEMPYLQNIKDLVTAIRSIKHDAVNHYTAIEGFLKMGLNELAVDYIKQLLQDSSTITRLHEVKNPHVSALLHSKIALCGSERISFSSEISATSQLSSLSANDLIVLVGSVLDAAIQSVLSEAAENRRIHFRWTENDREECLIVEHTGLPPESREIDAAARIAAAYGGTLTIDREAFTRVNISIPRKAQKMAKKTASIR